MGTARSSLNRQSPWRTKKSCTNCQIKTPVLLFRVVGVFALRHNLGIFMRRRFSWGGLLVVLGFGLLGASCSDPASISDAPDATVSEEEITAAAPEGAVFSIPDKPIVYASEVPELAGLPSPPGCPLDEWVISMRFHPSNDELKEGERKPYYLTTIYSGGPPELTTTLSIKNQDGVAKAAIATADRDGGGLDQTFLSHVAAPAEVKECGATGEQILQKLIDGTAMSNEEIEEAGSIPPSQ